MKTEDKIEMLQFLFHAVNHAAPGSPLAQLIGEAYRQTNQRPIPGHPGYYATRQGQIIGKKFGRPLKPWLAGSYLKGQYHERHESQGRERVGLVRDDGTRERCNVHALVALAFLGPRPAGHDIHHKNGNFRDNRVENLEYLPRAEHMKHHVKEQRDRRYGQYF